MGTRKAYRLVKKIPLEVGGVASFDVFCHLGGFHPSPTVIQQTLFQMLLVDVVLYIFPITADFGCHADSQFVLLQQSGNFGYQRNEFEPCADIALVLAELHGQRLHIMATALDELLVCVGFLNGCHIFALQVFGHSHFLGCLV